MGDLLTPSGAIRNNIVSFARVYYTAAGGTDFAVPFSYQDQGEVGVEVNGVAQILTTDYTWLSAGTIRFNTAPASGLTILIYRFTAKTTNKTVYADGTVDLAAARNLLEVQHLYGIQENYDLLLEALGLDHTDGVNFTARQKKIQKLANPVLSDDAAPKAYVDTAITLAQLSSLSTRMIELDSDSSWSPFGTPGLLVVSGGYQNAILGYAHMNLDPGTFALPAGINGYGKVDVGSTGNQVFGIYGLAELAATSGSAIGAEFTGRNLSGQTPDINLPPNSGIGTTTSVVKGLNITAGGTTYDASVGIHIGNEYADYTKPCFNTGQYIELFRQYGLFVEAQPSGTQTSAVLKNNGNGWALQCQVTGTFDPNGAVIVVLDSAGDGRFSVHQDGHLKWGVSPPVQTTVGAAGASAALPATPTGYLQIDVQGVTKVIPYYDAA